MKNNLLCLLIACSAMCFGADFNPKKNADKGSEVSFTENIGQVSDQYNRKRSDVLFSGTTGDLGFHLRKTGISYQFSKVESWKDDPDTHKHKESKVPDVMSLYRLDIEWEGANNTSVIEKNNTVPGYENFYLAACPEGITKVQSYKEIVYQNIYAGIDLYYYGTEGQLKYDFVLQPHADYRQIKGHVSGVNRIFVNKSGELVMETPFGTYSEKAPLVKQGEKVIKASWQVNGDYISYNIGAYDHNQELIIDPLVRVWGTFYGGYYSVGHACTTASNGDVYMAGFAGAPSSIIATTGSHQYTFGGFEDGYLVKFDLSGNRLWATYYGGNSSDRFYDCALDANGNIFATGITTSPTSPNVIATTGAHQPSILGNSGDAMLVKFNSSGIRQWGTYYGGNESEWAFGCCTDASGDVYICGLTNSYNGTFIATVGSHQPTLGSIDMNGIGINDAFLAKFSSSGTRLWGTYYGGTLMDDANSCSTDPAGNVYMAGATQSTTDIGTLGSEQPNFLGGNDDSYLVKFNSMGVRQWGTYYGSNSNSGGYDAGYACATSSNSAVYLLGVATSGYNGGTLTPVPVPSPASLIATPGTYQPLPNTSQNMDCYLAKFDPQTGLRVWGTYFGYGSQFMNCTTNAAGNVLVCGHFGSSSITTPGSYQTVNGGGASDAYLTEFNSAGTQLWGTLYGGTGWEDGFDCDYDNFGNYYLTGVTMSTNSVAIATPGSHQPMITPSNSGNAFLVKFSDCAVPVFSLTQTNAPCYGLSGGSATVTTTAPSLITTWSNGSNGPVVSNLPVGGFTCIVTNSCGASASQTLTISQPSAISMTASAAKPVICRKEASKLSVQASGGTGIFSYSWAPLSVAGSSASATPSITTIYTVTATDANGCIMTANVTQTVSACQSIDEMNGSGSIHLFPNPSSGEVYIETKELSRLNISDMSGKTVRSVDLQEGHNTLNISDLAAGCYLLELSSGTETRTLKLIKE